MNILAIRFARLGDIILLLPALGSLKAGFPGSRLTFLTGHRCAPIAELCPAIDEVMAVDRIAMRDGPPWRALRDIGRLVRDIRGRHFDLVVDFHSFRETNLLTRLSGAPVRIGMRRHNAPFLDFCFTLPPVLEDKSLHVQEMFQKVVEGVPGRVVPPSARLDPGANLPLGKLAVKKAERFTVVLYIAAPVPERIWPPERFAEVADYLQQTRDADVVVVSSPDRTDLAERVRKASRRPGRLQVHTDLTLPRLADVIGSSHLLVSNDTGPMHIGPAMGVETLGLFSVGYPEHFRPAGPGSAFLRGNPIELIQAKDAIETIARMTATADRDLRR